MQDVLKYMARWSSVSGSRCLPQHHKENSHDHQDPRPGLRQLREPGSLRSGPDLRPGPRHPRPAGRLMCLTPPPAPPAPGAGAQAATRQARPVRVQAHLSKWLMLYAIGAIAVGLAVGYPARAWAGQHSGDLSTWTTVAVFLVIYPMMVNLRVEAMVKAGRNVRGLGLALMYNFVWAPLVGLVLVRVFLHDPLLSLGFLLVMVVPCS